jgi:uncharacterized protein DUF4440/uncharacterized protein DUF3471
MLIATIAILTIFAAPPQLEKEIEGFHRELVTALRQGDRAALERMIADGFTFVHATGGLDTKQQYIDNTVSAAKANRVPNIERLDNQVQSFDGGVVVTVNRSVLHDRSDVLLRTTQVYVKRDDRWQWIAGQSTSLPTRPKALATIAPADRDAYAGRYELSPGRFLTVRADGEVLRANLPGFKEAELIPQSQSEFEWFNPELNVKAQLVFIRDDEGHVTHAAYRRDGKEVWRAARTK